ncbi:hypothetical protein [Micromonospora cathayae]|uniref:ATP-grasp target RiPP n=1 Tax=Micromonospora cathayae TaxID=3028804 RepID=A0ABY7ZVV3_9ACTN|nr:hypothetical protein [Micromonospora sp. HUAS 3]WDZ87186.1 hypothetical protein PVK37_12660 [Micromonospora sp. HUAS 3]
MSDRVVTTDIPLGDPGRGVFAYRVGDKVPEADVKANGWEDYVASPTSQAGKQAAAEASGEQAPSAGKRG